MGTHVRCGRKRRLLKIASRYVGPPQAWKKFYNHKYEKHWNFLPYLNERVERFPFLQDWKMDKKESFRNIPWHSFKGCSWKKTDVTLIKSIRTRQYFQKEKSFFSYQGCKCSFLHLKCRIHDLKCLHLLLWTWPQTHDSCEVS